MFSLEYNIIIKLTPWHIKVKLSMKTGPCDYENFWRYLQRTDLWWQGGGGLGGGLEVWDWQMQTIIQRMDEQRGPTV